MLVTMSRTKRRLSLRPAARRRLLTFLMIGLGIGAVAPDHLAPIVGLQAMAQEAAEPDPSQMTREQWRANIETAKRRLEQMRREHRSLTPPEKSAAEKDAENSRRALEDDSLQPGDIVATDRGLLRFKGGASPPRSREDFVPLDPPGPQDRR